MGDNSKLITHRCEGLIKERMSIRYGYRSEYFKRQEDIGWWLFGNSHNSEYGDHFIALVKIDCCPWCGELLKHIQ